MSDDYGDDAHFEQADLDRQMTAVQRTGVVALAAAQTTIVPGRDGGLGIIGALAAAQAEFDSITKAKEARIKGEGKRGEYEITYAYADIADVLAEVRPKLAGQGIATLQSTEYDGRAHYLMTRLVFAGDGSYVESVWRIRDNVTRPQDVGSELTYLRRYQLSLLCGVASEEDDDGARAQRQSESAQRRRSRQAAERGDDDDRPPPASTENRTKFREWLRSTMGNRGEPAKVQLRTWLAEQGIETNSARLTQDQIDAVHDYIEDQLTVEENSEPWDDGDPPESQESPQESPGEASDASEVQQDQAALGEPQSAPESPIDPRVAEITARVNAMGQEEVAAALIERGLPRNGNLATKRARLAVALANDLGMIDQPDQPGDRYDDDHDALPD